MKKELNRECFKEIVGGTVCKCEQFVPAHVGKVFVTAYRCAQKVQENGWIPDAYNTVWNGQFQNKEECRVKCCDQVGTSHYFYGSNRNTC